MAEVMAESPQAVALRLLELVAASEGKVLGVGTSAGGADKAWVLKTYEECIAAVLSRYSKWGPYS